MRIAPEIQDSLELRFSRLARDLNRSGSPIISLGLGEPGFSTPPAVVAAAAEALRQGFTRYSNPFGLPELCTRIARKLQEENGIAAAPEQVIVTPGAKMALSLVLAALLEPGDEAINITPCYTSFVPQLYIAEPQVVVRNIDLRHDDFRLDLEAIGAALNERTKVLLLNTPHNPTGWMISEAEIRRIGEILHGTRCTLICDEIYERLNFSGTAHFSPAARETLAERTVTINGFSKAFSMTGWRIGYLVVPDQRLRRIVSRLQQHLNTNTATFIQKAALVALDLDDGFLAEYRSNLAASARELEEAIAACPALSLASPKGGLFAFVDISKTGMSSDAFCTALLEDERVAATPGVAFGTTWDSHIRVSLAAGRDQVGEGIRRLARFAMTRGGLR